MDRERIEAPMLCTLFCSRTVKLYAPDNREGMDFSGGSMGRIDKKEEPEMKKMRNVMNGCDDM